MTLPATAWTHPFHERWPAITWASLAAEIDREITARLNTYPGRVERGRMTQAEMDWQLQLARAWREDVDRFAAAHRPLSEGRPMTCPVQVANRHGIAWRPRRGALLRELEQRRKHYPGWIAEGRLTQAAADGRVAALECLLTLYEWGYDFIPADPEDAGAEIRAILAEIAARTAPPQQELFA